MVNKKEFSDRIEYYSESGDWHREDGPAVEWANGDKEWHVNGKLHREDGPAIEWADGTHYWYLNGKLHRTNGPAVELPNGDRYWYLNGIKYTEDEHKLVLFIYYG